MRTVFFLERYFSISGEYFFNFKLSKTSIVVSSSRIANQCVPFEFELSVLRINSEGKFEHFGIASQGKQPIKFSTRWRRFKIVNSLIVFSSLSFSSTFWKRLFCEYFASFLQSLVLLLLSIFSIFPLQSAVMASKFCVVLEEIYLFSSFSSLILIWI